MISIRFIGTNNFVITKTEFDIDYITLDVRIYRNGRYIYSQKRRFFEYIPAIYHNIINQKTIDYLYNDD